MIQLAVWALETHFIKTFLFTSSKWKQWSGWNASGMSLSQDTFSQFTSETEFTSIPNLLLGWSRFTFARLCDLRISVYLTSCSTISALDTQNRSSTDQIWMVTKLLSFAQIEADKRHSAAQLIWFLRRQNLSQNFKHFLNKSSFQRSPFQIFMSSSRFKDL